tara:strand:- start:1167 stop:1355 length:189 start_codon:yes stop_codon:yes gene_type:complete
MSKEKRKLIKKHNRILDQIHNLQYNKDGSMKANINFRESINQKLTLLMIQEKEIYNKINTCK